MLDRHCSASHTRGGRTRGQGRPSSEAASSWVVVVVPSFAVASPVAASFVVAVVASSLVVVVVASWVVVLACLSSLAPLGRLGGEALSWYDNRSCGLHGTAHIPHSTWNNTYP